MAQPLNPAALPVDPTELQRHSLLARGMAEGLVPFDGGALRPDVDVAPRTAIYSASGFDLMAVLARVVTRPNPKVDLGPVDFSCSFVVSDAKKPDNPVVYCSNTFSKLTGYSMSEILGRNCRFLQAPGGDVRPGEVRKYTDNAIIHEIKQKLASFEECQFILMNYKKNGEPFINLVTCIPVQWGEKPNDYRFMVGFQIDLVEQPQNILARLRDGTYTVNYQSLWKPPDEINSAEQMLAITNEVDDLLTPSDFSPTPSFESFASTFNEGVPKGSAKDADAELAFYRAIVEHGKDFVHILSLRGRFLYVSRRATKRLLEYSEDELVGRGLSEFCHPADMLVVMRDMRNATSGEPLQLLYRFKRKRSGYIWLEARGHVYEGETKRTKCFVLSAREKAVGSCSTVDICTNVRDSRVDFWAKLSLSGHVLYATPSCIGVVGVDANTLTGSSLLDLVQAELREPLRRTIAEYGRSNALPDTSTRSPTIRLTLSTVNGLMPISMWIYRSPPGVANGMQSPSPCFVVVQIMSGQAQDEAPEGMLSSGNLPRDVYGIMDPTRASSFPYEREKLRSINKKLQEELASFQPSRKRPAEDITSTLASPFTAVFADASITM